MSGKKPPEHRTLIRECPVCGTTFRTDVNSPYKRDVETGRHPARKYKREYYCGAACKARSYSARGPGTRPGRRGDSYNQAHARLDASEIDPWRMLALSVISLAVEDYKNLLQGRRVSSIARGPALQWNIEEIEDFFGSGWAEELAQGLYSTEEMTAALLRMKSAAK